MAKVHEIYPQDKYIETINDLPITTEQVTLLIEDIDTAPLSYSEGSRYIFGGNSNTDRWICLRGLKCWYSKKALDNLSGPVDNGFVKGLTGSGYMTWSDTLLSNADLKNNLYQSFTLFIGDRNHTFTMSFTTDNSDIIVTITETIVNASTRYYRDKKFSLNGNDFKYIGIFPVVTSINTSNKTAQLALAFVVLDADGKPLLFQTKNASSDTDWVNTAYGDTHRMYINTEETSQGVYKVYQYTISFKDDYEFYYALGLTDIYEKKTMQDVIDILNQNNSGGD